MQRVWVLKKWLAYYVLRVYTKVILWVRFKDCFAMHKLYLWGIHCFYVALGTKAQRRFANVVRLCTIMDHLGKPRCIEKVLCAKHKTLRNSITLGWLVTCCVSCFCRERLLRFIFISREDKREIAEICDWNLCRIFLECFVIYCCDQGPKSLTEAKSNLCLAVCSL